MKGKVVNWNEDKGVGHIGGLDGNRYYFKLQDLKNRSCAEESDVITASFNELVGFGVNFEPGMQNMCAVATDIEFDLDVRNYGYEYPDKFKITKGLSVKDYQVVDHADYYICLTGSDKEELCKRMEEIAVKCGANACMAYVERRESVIASNDHLDVIHISAVPVILARHAYNGEPKAANEEIKPSLSEVCGNQYVATKASRKWRGILLAALSILIAGLFAVSETAFDLGVGPWKLLFGWEEVISLSVLSLLHLVVYLRRTQVACRPYRYESSLVGVKAFFLPMLLPGVVLFVQVVNAYHLSTIS